jgi:hypothetical protein
MHAFRILLCIAVAASLTGCFDYMMDRAVNGTYCVGPDVKVGDLISDGQTRDKLTVVKLTASADGSPYEGCSVRMPIRAKVEKR